MADFSPVVNDSGVEFDVIVQPKAGKDTSVGLYDGRLKIRITAPPVDGKANEALKKFLAKTFKVSRSRVIIVSGETGRRKRLRIQTDNASAVLKTLEHLTG